MPNYKVTLEDKGQDFLCFIVDEKGIVMSAEPYQTEVWKGALIPIDKQKIGELCMIHNPPNINYGYLKYKVLNITLIKNK